MKVKVDFSEWMFCVEDTLKELEQKIAEIVLEDIVSDPYFDVQFGYHSDAMAEKFVETDELYVSCSLEEGCKMYENLEVTLLRCLEYEDPDYIKKMSNRLRFLADKLEKDFEEYPPRVNPNLIPKW